MLQPVITTDRNSILSRIYFFDRFQSESGQKLTRFQLSVASRNTNVLFKVIGEKVPIIKRSFSVRQICRVCWAAN